jgi:hypothetical protein
MDRWFSQEKEMKKRNRTKLVHEGKFVAEVDVELIETDEGWSPYLSLEDSYKLDDVRDALRRGDLEAAARLARVFKLMPVFEPASAANKSFQSDPG